MLVAVRRIDGEHAGLDTRCDRSGDPATSGPIPVPRCPPAAGPCRIDRHIWPGSLTAFQPGWTIWRGVNECGGCGTWSWAWRPPPVAPQTSTRGPVPSAQAPGPVPLRGAPQIPAATVRDLATGGFIDRAEIVIFLGDPGTGKSHLSIALGIEASRRVRFTTTAGLVNELLEARDDRSLSKVVARYARACCITSRCPRSRVELLILDELMGLTACVRHAVPEPPAGEHS
jgi:hypothetical protein